MITLQDDLIELYNSLTEFSKTTVQVPDPMPIKVSFDPKGISSPLVMEQGSTVVRLRVPIYYCLALEELENNPEYLLPGDYDVLMSTLTELINSSRLLEDHTCISPENFGFDIYAIDYREYSKGPNILGRIRFISGSGWFYRLRVKMRYKLWK